MLRTNNKSGSVLVVALLVILVASALIGGMAVYTQHNARAAQRVILRDRAMALGDGVLEDLFDKWRYYQSAETDPNDRKGGLSWGKLKTKIGLEKGGNAKRDPVNRGPKPKAVDFMALNGSGDQYEIRAATPTLVPLGDNDQPIPEGGALVDLRDRRNYLATVRVSFNALGDPSNNYVDVSRVFTKAGSNIFQFFLFSTLPVTEIHPGPTMKIFGRNYIGGDLYNAYDSLQYKGEVTFGGDFYANYYSGDGNAGHMSTTPNIGSAPSLFSNNWAADNPPHNGSPESVFDTPSSLLDPVFLDHTITNNVDSDNNPNNDGYHEMIELHQPNGEDPFQHKSASQITSERLADNVDYRVEVDVSNNVSVYVNDGSGNFPKAKSGDPVAATIVSAVTTNQMMQDAREGAGIPKNGVMRTIEFDVSKITNATGTGKLVDTQQGTPQQDGLAIYVYDSSSGTQVDVPNPFNTSQTIKTGRRAVVVKNGAVLPNEGLTIATPHAAYVWGDFNSGKTGTNNPESNSNPTVNDSAVTPDLSKVEASNYDRKPAAVAADAVNILSNSWNMSKIGQTGLPASTTTINAALIAGNVPSENKKNYSGGVENFPRFHENWSGKYLTICGTLALMFNSEESIGIWDKAKYSPPNRRWYYDTNLLSKNVPGFRAGTNFLKGQRMTGM